MGEAVVGLQRHWRSALLRPQGTKAERSARERNLPEKQHPGYRIRTLFMGKYPYHVCRSVQDSRHRLLTSLSLAMELLGGGGLPASISVVGKADSVYERPVTDALIKIMHDLYTAQHMGEAAVSSRGDLNAIDEILAMVDSISDELAGRFDLPAVHVTLACEDRRRRRRTDKMDPPESGPANELFTWRPRYRLWTAPLVEPASAWAFWMHRYTNLAWSRQLRYESPARASRVVVDSLAGADELVGRSTFEEAARRLEADGVERIDFSWRCVLEAECSILLGERKAADYPCSLGTESSVWLTSPAPTAEIEADETVYGGPQATSGWFHYG